MTTTKKGISACELKGQISHKGDMIIWSVKIRLQAVMRNRDDLYQILDMIEFDEGYFEKQVPEHTKSNLKRGRGSEGQIKVAVIAEFTLLENLKSGKIFGSLK